MHGKVERKIQEVKKSIDKTMLNERLSVIQSETCAAEIANRINYLPLALGNIVSEFETMDLIRPNRLKLGRSNDRSSSGCVKITFRFKENPRNKPKFIQRMVRKLAPFTRTKHHVSTKVV